MHRDTTGQVFSPLSSSTAHSHLIERSYSSFDQNQRVKNKFDPFGESYKNAECSALASLKPLPTLFWAMQLFVDFSPSPCFKIKQGFGSILLNHFHAALLSILL
jgi:hypothetical protein